MLSIVLDLIDYRKTEVYFAPTTQPLTILSFILDQPHLRIFVNQLIPRAGQPSVLHSFTTVCGRIPYWIQCRTYSLYLPPHMGREKDRKFFLMDNLRI